MVGNIARGWHNESVISPDYETAALLLQLQQDMLAYVDDEAGTHRRDWRRDHPGLALATNGRVWPRASRWLN